MSVGVAFVLHYLSVISLRFSNRREGVESAWAKLLQIFFFYFT